MGWRQWHEKQLFILFTNFKKILIRFCFIYSKQQDVKKARLFAALLCSLCSIFHYSIKIEFSISIIKMLHISETLRASPAIELIELYCPHRCNFIINYAVIHMPPLISKNKQNNTRSNEPNESVGHSFFCYGAVDTFVQTIDWTSVDWFF